MPGRKVVLLLSEGFFLGRGTLSESAYDLRRITDAATRSGVVVYSHRRRRAHGARSGRETSPRGSWARRRLRSVARGERSGREPSRGDAGVAEETGGFAVLNHNDIGAGLKRILDDNEVYYLLAYEPVSPRRAGRFRSIEVRLPARPDLVARTRKGYFEPRETPPARKPREPSPKQAAAEAEERVRDAFTSIVPLRGLPVHLAADFIDLPDTGPTVVVNVDVDVASLRSRERRPRRRQRRDRGSRLGPGRRGRRAVRGAAATRACRPETRSSARPDGVAFSRWFALKPGLYQVRVAALGEGPDETGSASQWIEVPDLAARQLDAEQRLPRARLGGMAGSRGEGGGSGRGRAPRARPAELPARKRRRRRPLRLQRPDRRGGRARPGPPLSAAVGRPVDPRVPPASRCDPRTPAPGSACPAARSSPWRACRPASTSCVPSVEDRSLPATAERSADFTVE